MHDHADQIEKRRQKRRAEENPKIRKAIAKKREEKGKPREDENTFVHDFGYAHILYQFPFRAGKIEIFRLEGDHPILPRFDAQDAVERFLPLSRSKPTAFGIERNFFRRISDEQAHVKVIRRRAERKGEREKNIPVVRNVQKEERDKGKGNDGRKREYGRPRSVIFLFRLTAHCFPTLL